MAWLFLAVLELLMFGWPVFLGAQLLMLQARWLFRLRWRVALIPAWVFLGLVAFVAGTRWRSAPRRTSPSTEARQS